MFFGTWAPSDYCSNMGKSYLCSNVTLVSFSELKAKERSYHAFYNHTLATIIVEYASAVSSLSMFHVLYKKFNQKSSIVYVW